MGRPCTQCGYHLSPTSIQQKNFYVSPCPRKQTGIPLSLKRNSGFGEQNRRKQGERISVVPGNVAAVCCASVDVSEADRYQDLDDDTPVKWVIRTAEQEEALLIADLMARAFHTPASLKIVDKAKFALFKAEVVDSMITKLKYTDKDVFVCLVAQTESGELCGAVEISQQNLHEVQKVLKRDEPEKPSYAYMAGMAVKEEYRRQGLGSTLLAAAEQVARDWGKEEQVLHVYADNVSALEFYTRNGYNGINFESDIFTKLGKRSRITMWKRF